MTAKEKFIASAHKKPFEEMIQTAAFESACDSALLALLEDTPLFPTNPSVGWDAHNQMCGARRVIDILKSLPLSVEPPKRERQKTPYHDLQ